MSENQGVGITFHDVPVPLVMIFCRLIDQRDNLRFWKGIRNVFALEAELMLDSGEMCDGDTARWMNDLAALANEMAEESSLWAIIEEKDEDRLDVSRGTGFDEAFYASDETLPQNDTSPKEIMS